MTEPILLRGLDGEPRSILLRDDRIAALGPEAEAAAGGARTLTPGRLSAHPGFIELQVNGLDDLDFTTEPSAMWRVGARLARHGVTAFLPTIVTSPRGTVERAIAAFAAVQDGGPIGAVPLGLHVEGPFIAPARRGAHDERHIRDPDLEEIADWLVGGVAVVTIAPERPGAIEAIELIARSGGIASVGHTDADAAAASRAVDAGARYATHLFNAMPPLLHRAPGPVGALLADDRVTVGIISDGVHLDPLIVRFVARVAAGRVSLVSDAVAHRLGGAELAVEDGTARLEDGTLAGSVRRLDHGVRTFAAATGSVASAIEAVTATPARLLGLEDGRGTLRAGGRADLVLLTPDLEVAVTIVGGRPAFLAEGIRWT